MKWDGMTEDGFKNRQQDIAGREKIAGGIGEVAGFAMENPEPVAPVEKGTVNAAAVGRVEVDDAIIKPAQGSAGDEGLHYLPVLHLRQADNIRHPAELIPREADGLGDSVAFVPEMRPIFEQVLHIPKHAKVIRFPANSSGEPEKQEQKYC